jgi:hypothetical protein
VENDTGCPFFHANRLKKTTPGVLFLLIAVSCAGPQHPLTVERMDVGLAVSPDGQAHVSEHLTVQTGDPPVTSFRRYVPVWKHDGVTSADTIRFGPVPASYDPERGHIVPGPALDAQWTFPSAPRATHELDLTYTAANVVGISGIRGLLSWSVLPAHRDWEASAVTIRVELPDSAILLQDPWVEESGWTVVRLPHGMTATRAHVSRSESATVGIEFTIDRMTPATPQWQADAEFLDEFVPAFVAAALFILVIGAGILVLLRIKHPAWRVRPDSVDSPRIDTEAPALTPAAQAALLRGRAQGDRTAIAALVAAGLADRDRVSVARDLRRAAVAIVVFGLAAWAGTALTVTQFGAWPLVVPWSVVVVGVAFAIAGRRYGVLSERGARARMLYFARVRDGRTSE